MMTRRKVLGLSGMSMLFSVYARVIAHGPRSAAESDAVTEEQSGDPDVPSESVTFSPSAIRRFSNKTGKATFEKWSDTLPLSMLSTARQFLGNSRATTPAQISEFLALFNLPMKTADGYVPFCAAGLSFCALMGYAATLNKQYDKTKRLEALRKLMPDLEHYYFYPTVSCVDMYHIAAGKRQWVNRKPKGDALPKPGWIVLFDWKGRGTPDHCGIVQQASKDSLKTVEFNTTTTNGSERNGGTVAEKTRPYDQVYGFIITDSAPTRF